MPANTVKVDRTTKHGNPWKVGDRDHNNDLIENSADAVNAYRAWIDDMLDGEQMGHKMPPLAEMRALRGKNLACWCALDAPCHADVLLTVANK